MSRPKSEAAEFNAVSARLQRLAGVQPAECLRVRLVTTARRTPLKRFFAGLEQGVWLSPHRGEWLEHDQVLHWPGVRELHPQSIDLVTVAASIGKLLCETDRDMAEEVASALDNFIDYDRRRLYYAQLVEIMDGLLPNGYASPDYATQEYHYASMDTAQAALQANTGHQHIKQLDR